MEMELYYCFEIALIFDVLFSHDTYDLQLDFISNFPSECKSSQKMFLK